LVHGMLGASICQGQLMRVARLLVRYKLDLMGVQEVRCDIGCTVRAGDCIYSMENEMKSLIGNRIFLYTTDEYRQLREWSILVIVVSNVVLRVRWCNIIVLNVRVPSEKKSDDSKYSIYNELEQVFNHFS